MEYTVVNSTVYFFIFGEKMDKIVLTFKQPKTKIVEYNGLEIEVRPFLEMAEMVFLINQYISEYFDKDAEGVVSMSPYRHVDAEYALRNYIYQMCTNIDMENTDVNIISDTKLWGAITGEISNYWDFNDLLKPIIDDIKKKIELQFSAGALFMEVKEKLLEYMDKLKELDPEEIKKMQETGFNLLEKVNESSILGESSPKKRVRHAKKE